MAKTAYHRFHVAAGSRITQAITEAVGRANHLQVMVAFEFNGHDYLVFPGDTRERVFLEYDFRRQPEGFQEVMEAVADLA